MAECYVLNSSENSSSSDSQEDLRLNFYSESFDPILALRAVKIKVPEPKAKKYDNLEMYKTNVDRKECKQLKKQQKVDETLKATEMRRWLPHQMPVPSTRALSRKKPKKNVLVKMEKAKGPLAVLRQCIEQRLKLKIWTRNEKGIRGYCIAYVVAFDKHWNLALEDVTEIWSRKRKKKLPVLEGAKTLGRYNFPVKVPAVQVFPDTSNKKREICSRVVDQLVMRGEHIVMINIIDYKPSESEVGDENPKNIQKRDEDDLEKEQ